MKYKVIEINEITKEILEKMLEDAYKEGYQDGYEKGKMTYSPTVSFPPHYNYRDYLSCDNATVNGYQPKITTTNRTIIPPKGTKGEDA